MAAVRRKIFGLWLERRKPWKVLILLVILMVEPTGIEPVTCRSASNLDPPKAPARAEPSGATLRCAPPGSALQLHNLGSGQLFDADPGHGFGAV